MKLLTFHRIIGYKILALLPITVLNFNLEVLKLPQFIYEYFLSSLQEIVFPFIFGYQSVVYKYI